MRQPKSRLQKVEKQLSDAQKALLVCHQQMEDSGLYESDQADTLKAVLLEEAQLKSEIENLEESWLELEAELEEIAAQFEVT